MCESPSRTAKGKLLVEERATYDKMDRAREDLGRLVYKAQEDEWPDLEVFEGRVNGEMELKETRESECKIRFFVSRRG